MSFTIPANLVGSSTAVASDTFLQLAPFLYLILGTIFALLIIETLIHAIRPK